MIRKNAHVFYYRILTVFSSKSSPQSLVWIIYDTKGGDTMIKLTALSIVTLALSVFAAQTFAQTATPSPTGTTVTTTPTMTATVTPTPTGGVTVPSSPPSTGFGGGK